MTDSLATEHSLPYDLDDRYRSDAPAVLLTGVQAVARLLVEQHELDLRRGLRTATFISGYQGSPLGGVDRMLSEMPDVLAKHDITFLPGLNEELAATSVWGSQVELPLGTATHDGIVGVWYGKGPGLDRATDTIRHGNLFGANPLGGSLLLVGDDPGSKSSTLPVASERSLAALNIPVLFPRNSSEVITFGLHAIAMSRASGCIVALKIVADVADGAWVVDDGVSDVIPATPEIEWEGRPFTYRQRPIAASADMVIATEAELLGPRRAIVTAYAADNELNVPDIDPDNAKVGLVASGTAYDSLRQALLDLGLTDDALHRAGIRVLRMGLLYPMEPGAISHFARGLEEIFVVEEKAAFLETQLREILYGSADAPRIIGKRDSRGRQLVPPQGELTVGRLLGPVRHVLQERVAIDVPRQSTIQLPLLPAARAPYFCSGCPHNRSTAVPEGSMAAGGIGCHTMVALSNRKDTAVTGLTQMGGEGAQWIGQSSFTDTPHMFQNLGDGTFFHSGQLAVQACIAAGVNITYKILYNEVVAMTGAQEAEGALSVERLTHKLASEGVAKIIVCADEPERHRRRRLAKGTTLWHRNRLDEAQRILRDTPGVTVLIYDQHCAADARRQRKRGTLPARNTRVVINEAVCEGCGDCGVKSNCLSVQPVDTELGRKTRIDQTSCNTDYSCLDGDCPSFVTVEVGPEAKSHRNQIPEPPTVPAPAMVSDLGTQDVLMAGIGGTGIVTVNQVLATAALRAGLHVESLDQTGLSQKAGPVTAHLRFSEGALEPSNRLAPGSADCIIAFDLLTAVTEKNLAFGDVKTTVSVASTSKTVTGAMVYDSSIGYPETVDLLARLESSARGAIAFDVLQASENIFGNTTTANFLLVGAAYQSGALRIPADAIEEAIGINGVAVSANVAAFRWGRAAVADRDAFDRVAFPAAIEAPAAVHIAALDTATFDGEVRRLVEGRAPDLVGFQNVKTATRYVETVQRVWDAERNVTEDTRFSEGVARYLFKLTAYKDEYEVARLLTDPRFAAAVKSEVPGGRRPTFKLHPPTTRAMGRSKKMSFGPRSHGLLRSLARLKVLRGTPFDPFGYAHVRRLERRLLAHYGATITELGNGLAADSYDRAAEIASLPDLIRGYEGVKLANVERYVAALAALDVDTSGLRTPASGGRP